MNADRLAAAGIITLSLAAALLFCGVCGAQEQLHYHYFKERRPLQLDTNRVAILQTRPAPALALSQSIRNYGLVQDATRTLPIAGWSLATTPAIRKTESAARDLLSRMAGDGAFDFVAPVFVGDDGGPVIVTPDILIGFDPNVTEPEAEAILAGVTNGVILHRNWGQVKGAYHLHTFSKNGMDVLGAANQLAERPGVRFAEPDMIFTGHGELIPNDPGFPNLWGLRNTGQSGGIAGMDMNATQAWDITNGSPSIIVVIIDVGVQQDHPDINRFPGSNFTSDASTNGGPVNACDNHGTAVAGCVSAIINNSLGTVGIAPGCRSASARTFISNGSCDGTWASQASWTANALAWALGIGARVSNNSNYYGFQSSAIASEYSYARGQGMVHFASAGNNAANSIVYPASLPDVNSVAALNESGSLASFSNYGNGLDFSAPGQDIYTTDRTGTAGWINGDYVWASGTSFASPYAAGVAALVLSLNPALDATNVEVFMQHSCVDLGAPGYDTTYGWGFVNAYNALLVTESTSLQVIVSPPDVIPLGALWQLDGGIWRSNAATVFGLSVGSHTVSFSSVAGWTSPSSQSVTVSNGQLTRTTGVYVRLTPDPPSNLQATTISYNTICLTWQTVSNADGQKLERSADGTNFSQIDTLSPAVASICDSPLNSCTTYYYRIRAYNTAGDSAYSNIATSTTHGCSFTATWLGGIGNWSTSGKWDVGVVPNNGGNAFSVLVDGSNPAPSTVTLDMNATVSNITIDGDDSLVVDGGRALSATGSLTLNGAVWVANGQLTLNGWQGIGSAATGQMTISNGTVTANDLNLGLQQGSLGLLTIVGGTTTFNSLVVGSAPGATGMVLVAGGQLTPTSSGYISLGGAGVGKMAVSNGAVLAETIDLGGSVLGFNGGEGTLRIMGGAVSALSQLIVGWSGSQTCAVMMTQGTLNVTNASSSALLKVEPGGKGQLTLAGGVMNVDQLQSDGFGFAGSTLRVGAFNPINTSTTLTNSGGVLAPGAIGTAGRTTITGRYIVNAPSAVLAIDLGGPAAASTFVANSSGFYDTVTVTSNAVLGGNLTVNLINGYEPNFSPSTTFTIMTAGSLIGGFNNLDASSRVIVGPESNRTFHVTITGTSVVLDNYSGPPSTYDVGAADLQDQDGNLMPTGGVVVLVADTGNNGFADPQPSFALRRDATWGIDDKVVGLWDLGYSYFFVGRAGALDDVTTVPYTEGISAGQKLQLYWFPSLTLASNTLGVTYYGKYTDTNSPSLDGSDLWNVPSPGSYPRVLFLTQSEGGSNPDAAGRAILSTLVPASAGFIASPTKGAAPLAVAFTDTSTGTITNWHWDFGDGNSTNLATAANPQHTYGVGTYTVALVVSGDGGVSTNIQLNAITVLTPFAAWQQQYFGCTNCAPAEASADPDGDGQSNWAEFLTGTDPTNSASTFRITSLVSAGNDVLVTWTIGSGKTNALQAAAGDPSGSYTNAFADIFTVTNTIGSVTNYLDASAATNSPARYYRVRLVP